MKSKDDLLKYAYDMGRDSVLHGANTVNCHFEIFNTPERTKRWEQGVKDAKKEQEEVKHEK